MLWRQFFSNGNICRSHTEWFDCLKWRPTGAVVFSWDGWVTVPLWPRNLSLNDLLVSPMYWGLVGQALPPFLQVMQYTKSVVLQVILSLIFTFSPVEEHVISLIILSLNSRWSHTGQLFCQHGLNPESGPADLVLLTGLLAGSLALTSISPMLCTLW